MPLYKDLSDDVTKILIWEFDENEKLDSDLLLEPENQAKILGYHPNKISEFLMVRKMLKVLLPNHKILYRVASIIFFECLKLIKKDEFKNHKSESQTLKMP